MQGVQAAYLSKKRYDTAVHDLLCKHLLFVQLPNELDIAQGATACLHSRRLHINNTGRQQSGK